MESGFVGAVWGVLSAERYCLVRHHALAAAQETAAAMLPARGAAAAGVALQLAVYAYGAVYGREVGKERGGGGGCKF